MEDILDIYKFAFSHVEVHLSTHKLLGQQGYIKLDRVITTYITAFHKPSQFTGNGFESWSIPDILVCDAVNSRGLWWNRHFGVYLVGTRFFGTVDMHLENRDLDDAIRGDVDPGCFKVKKYDWIF